MKKALIAFCVTFCCVFTTLWGQTINITITPVSSSTDYEFDGDSHTLTTFTVTSGALRPDEYIVAASAVMDSAYILPGTYSVRLKPVVRIENIYHEDVTSTYNITYGAGTLVIANRATKYRIQPQTKSAQNPFSGELQELDGFATNSFEVSGHTYTLSGLTAHAEGTNVGVYPMSVSGTPVVKLGTLDVTSQFDVEIDTLNLKITKYPLAIVVDTVRPYNGNAFVVDYTRLQGALVDGDAFTAGEFRTSGSNVGVYKLDEMSVFRTQNLQTLKGIENYEVSVSVRQEIARLQVVDTVRGNSLTVPYDGNPHSISGYTLSSNNPLFLQSYITQPETAPTATRMVAGTSTMGMRATQFTNTNNNFDVTFHIIDGFVKIEPIGPIQITTATASKTYDGSPLTDATYTYTGTLVSGDVLSATVEGSITNAGIVNNVLLEYHVMKGTDDVTDSYTFQQAIEGKLTVNPVNIYVTTRDSIKMFDGTPLENHRYTMTGNFVGTDSIRLSFTGFQTEQGESYNGYDPVYVGSTNPANYLLHNTLGKLKVVDSLKLHCMTFRINCYGELGSADVYAQYGHEGIPPYQYKLDGGAWQTSPTASVFLNNLSAETHKVVMVDHLGIKDSVTFTLHEPSAPLGIDTIKVTNTPCADNSGKAEAVIVGGTPVQGDGGLDYYFYYWTRGLDTIATTPFIKDMAPGSYTLKVQDDYGCVTSKNFEIQVNQYIHIRDFVVPSGCSKSGGVTIVPENSTDGYVPTGTVYTWGAPEIQPASAAAQVTGYSTGGTAQNSISTGVVTNNSGVAISVIYTVYPSLEPCCPIGENAPFTVTLTIGGDDVDHESIGITAGSVNICSNVGITDTILVVNLSGLSVSDNYTLNWTGDQFGNRSHVLPRGTTRDTIHIALPDVCYGNYTYGLSIADSKGCVHLGSGRYSVAPGTWSVPVNPEVQEVKCVSQAVAPHLKVPAEQPVVATSCGDEIVPIYSGYAVGEPCDMTIHHVYTYKDCKGSSHDWEAVYHVKDDVSPTTRTDYPRTMRAAVLECVFTVPSLIDSLMPIMDNCGGAIWYSQNPSAGTVIEKDTNVVLRLQDFCGNDVTATIRVTVDDTLDVEATAYDSHCYNVNDGYVIGSFTGGVPPYDVFCQSTDLLFSRGFSSTGAFDFQDLPDGTYEVYVHSANGCVSNQRVEVEIQDRDEILEVTAHSTTRPYDGTALKDTLFTVTHGALVSGDSLAVTINGSRTNVGSAQNHITDIRIYRDGIDVSCEYNLYKVDGTLTVTKRPVTLQSATDTKNYDGTALENHTVTIPSGSFVAGQGIDSYTVTGSQTYVGESENHFTYTLLDGTDPENYSITTQYGVLTVSKVATPIVIRALDSTKVYDGSPLTQSRYEYTPGVLFAGDVLEATTTGSQTPVGVGYNMISSYRIMRGSQDVTNCYTISPCRIGTLTVTQRPLTLTAGSKLNIPYDGDEHTWEDIPGTTKYTITSGSLAPTDELTNVQLSGAGTLVGSHPTYVELSSIVIKDRTTPGANLKENYAINVVNGTLEIVDRTPPYPIVVIAHSETIQYDGAYHTCSGYDTVVVFGDTTLWDHTQPLNVHLINEHGNDHTYTITGLTATRTERDANTYSVNITGTPRVLDITSADVTAQFSVTTKSGKFIIQKAGALEINVVDTKRYDANPLATAYNKAGTTTTVNMAAHDALSAGKVTTESPAIGTYQYTAATPWKSEITTDYNTAGGISNYETVTYNVTQTITKGNTMTVTCPSGANITKVYDGNALQPAATANASVHDGTPIVIEYSTDGGANWSVYVPSITHYAESPLAVQVRACHPYYDTVYCNYTLTIKKRPVTLTSATANKEYDQTDLTASTITITGSGFASGEGLLDTTVTGRIRNVVDGSAAHKADNPFTYNLKSNTTATDYAFDTVVGKLWITPRPVTITSADSTRGYHADPTNPVQKHYASVTSAKGFLGGDTVSYSGWGSQSIPGYSANTFSIAGFTHGSDATSTIDNYQISRVNGTLRSLETFTLTISSQNDTVMYDGLAHTGTKFRAQLDGVELTRVSDPNRIAFYVFGDQNIVVVTPTANITNVGNTPSTFTYEVQFNTVDITSCYPNYVVRDTGYVYVVPRPLTITVDATKEYDNALLATAYNSADLTTTGFATGTGVNDRLTAGVITTDMDTVHIYNYNNNVSNGKNSTITTPFVIKNVSNVIINDNYQISYVVNQAITPSDNYNLYCPGTANNAQTITKTYDGDSLKATAIVTGQYTGDVLRIQYSVDNGTTWSDTVPRILHVSDTKTIKVKASHHDYETKDCSYNLTINKRNVKPTSATDEKVYDHTALTNATVTTPTTGSYLPWVTGEEATYTVTGTQTEVGSSKNLFDFTWNANAIQNDYIVKLDSGLLTVTPTSILEVYCPGTTNNSAAVTKTYDGVSLNPVATFNNSAMYGTDASEVVIEYNYGSGWTTTQPSITHYVQSPVNVQVRATHRDYSTATCNYTLTINKRPITITSADSTQVYNTTENRKEVTTVTSGSFVSGESFVYNTWTGRTHLGEQDNSFKFAPGTGTDTNDYAVTRVFGKLKITASPLAVVTCPSGNAITKMYDGTALAPTASATGIGSDVVPVQYATSATGPWQNTPISITNVGTQQVYVRTNNPDYQVQTCDYVLTDTCRRITLTSQDSTRKYNDLALNAHRVVVGGDGFASGESFTYSTFPAPVDSGVYSNTFTYAAASGTSLSNYCVTPIYGTLTITRSDDRTINCPSTAAQRTHTYDGELFNPAVTASGISGSGDSFTIEYSYDGATGWGTTPLGLTDVGTKHVYVRATNNNYDTITCDYELEVVCRPITLTSGTEYRTYDGTTWSKPTVTVGGDGLVSGQTITYSNFPTIKVVDTITNTFDYSFDAPAAATNYCVTVNNGSIGVKRATLSIECPGTLANTAPVTKMYDGTKLNPAADTSDLYAGDVATLKYSVDNGSTWSDTVPYITHVGTKDVKVRATHHDYDTAYCDYTLEVTCRHITLTSGSKSLTYNGTTWDYQSVTVTGDGLADGEHIDSTNFTTILNVGTKDNEFTYTFRSPAQAGDYCVDNVNYGTLTVTKADFNVECPGTVANPLVITKVYDGTPLQPAADTSGLIGSDVATIEYSTDGGSTWGSTVPSIANVGTLHVDVRATNSNYNTQTCDYDLEITPYTTPVVVEIVGHHNLFNYDTYQHSVGGFDTTCTDALYAAVMDTSFSFTGVDSVRRTAIGLDSLNISVADFANHNPNFTDVTFKVKKGWIEIKDVIKPVFVVGCGDITITSPLYPNEGANYRHSGTAWDAQATDNYAFDSLYYLLSGATVRTVPTAQIESLDGQLFNFGTTVVTWIAKDVAGNDTTCSYNVTVEDNIPPVVVCPRDTLVMCYGDIPAGASTYAELVALGGSASDVGSGVNFSTFSMSASYDGIACKDTLRRTYSIFDIVGNEGNCVQRITIKDTVKPTFTVPTDLALCRNNTTGEIEAPISVTGDVTDEADNCSTGLDATWADADTTLTDADTRIIHRVWTLVDDCGNTTNKTQNITIYPSIKTVGNVDITCPNDTVVVLDYGRCDTAILLPSPVFVNHMTGSNVVVSKDVADDYRYAAETTTDVTWTFTDDCGATQTCLQKVTIHYPPCGGVLDSVTDADGFRYSSVRIGCYCWTGENLRSTKYSDGTPIANYTYYEHIDSLENLYGKLYSWYSAARVAEGDNTAIPVDSVAPHGTYVQGVCPAGWALPTLDEFLQMVADAGDVLEKVKDAEQSFWYDGTAGTLPNSGFDARGAGEYNAETGAYQNLLVGAYFWTTTNSGSSMVMDCASIPNVCMPVEVISTDKRSGLSIRCIRKK